VAKRSKETAVHHRKLMVVEGGKFITRVASERVRVLARAEGYVMVRKPHAYPFVVSEKDLEEVPRG